MTKLFVNELKSGDKVDSNFAVLEKQPVKEYKNGFMFTVKVSDKTDHMDVKYFGGTNKESVEGIWRGFDVGDIVHIIGEAGEWQNRTDVAINPESGKIEKTDDFDPVDYVRKTEKDVGQMISQLKQIIEDVSDSDIKKLLKGFFDDSEFMKSFAAAPAAMSRHHNYVGGLLEHVLSLIEISKTVVKIYPKLNLDYLVAGCIFHDIGKIQEYKVGLGITYSNNGKLLGHIPIGYKMVSDKIDKLESFPEVKAQKILHMILSHHGQLDWGSPIKPVFAEAVALHFIDNVDAKIKGVFQDIGEVNSDVEWSAVTRDYGRLFLK